MDVKKELIEALEPFVRHGRALGAFSVDPGPFSVMTDKGHRDIPKEDFCRARKALSRARSADEQLYRHKARGTEYTVLGKAEVQTSHAIHEGERLVVYRGVDDKIWARPVVEFYDGRFEPVEAASARISAGDKDGENPVERSGNVETATPPDDLVEEEARQRAVEVVAKIEMDREGYPLSRTQEEIYTDACETVNAVLQALSPHLSSATVEREKIVAWLRRQPKLVPLSNIHMRQNTPSRLADAISRGDHISGEGR